MSSSSAVAAAGTPRRCGQRSWAGHQAEVGNLGGGSGGYAAGVRAGEVGQSGGLLGKDKVGGTWLDRGFIPNKALLHAGEVADAARESSAVGVNATFEGIDMA